MIKISIIANFRYLSNHIPLIDVIELVFFGTEANTGVDMTNALP